MRSTSKKTGSPKKTDKPGSTRDQKNLIIYKEQAAIL